MKIHILTNYDFISYYFMYPLLVNKGRLLDAGVEIRFHDKIHERLFDCDAVLLDSKFFREFWSDRERCLSLIQNIREKSRYLIWLDTTDSTGGTHFQVLPYVDKYWKKQLLKDVRLYEKKYYGARVYTDYYYREFGIEDGDVYSVDPVNSKFLGKISSSWNLGLGPTSINSNVSKFMRRIPWAVKERMKFRFRVNCRRGFARRENRICFRGSVAYRNKVLSYQRMRVTAMLNGRGVSTRAVRHSEYMKELRNSRIGVSPFGSGEICFRDFEIVLSGAVLFKPKMEHVDTYPNIFVENETYVPFEWDFSDFDEKADFLLENGGIAANVGEQAQERYRAFFSEAGQESFCSRFISMIKD